jgi:hypothetical protein
MLGHRIEFGKEEKELAGGRREKEQRELGNSLLHIIIDDLVLEATGLYTSRALIHNWVAPLWSRHTHAGPPNTHTGSTAHQQSW